jgi:coatomer protein complex subunit gamma
VILESAPVRASAVIALAKFAAKVPSLRPSISVILRRTMQDLDDEVRDRAVFYLRVLEQKDEDLITRFIIEDLAVNVKNLEQFAASYLQQPSHSQPLDISAVPVADIQQPASGEKPAEEAEVQPKPAKSTPETPTTQNLSALHPKLAHIGIPFKSAKAVKLSESDSDYVVACIKHTFADHVVFQFNCTNKVSSQKLHDVTIEMDMSGIEGVSDEFVELSISSLDYDCTGSVFLCFQKDPSVFPIGKTSNVLKYKYSERDPETGETLEDTEEDDFELEDLKVNITDYIADISLNFKEQWEALKDNETTGTTKDVAKTNLQNAVDKFINKVGLSPLGERKVQPKKNSHSLYFSGHMTNDVTVLIAVQLSTDESGATVTKVAVRSSDTSIATEVLNHLLKK